MGTFSSIIDSFGGPAEFGTAIGIPIAHARTMKARDSISPGYWRRTAAAAASRGIEGAAFEELAMIAALEAERRLAAEGDIGGSPVGIPEPNTAREGGSNQGNPGAETAGTKSGEALCMAGDNSSEGCGAAVFARRA